MKGLINWNALWQMKINSHQRDKSVEDAKLCDDNFANLCANYMIQKKEHTERQISKVKLSPDYSVLDIGSGVGRLSIPISKIVKNVTAVEPSQSMLACLKENIEKENARNVTYINKQWEEVLIGVDIDPHDVVIASGSLVMFEMQEALAKMDAASKGYVYLFTSADKWMNEELWERLYGNKPLPDPIFIYLYNILYNLGIYANIEFMDSVFDQRYNSLEEAVKSWKAFTNIGPDKEAALRNYLSEKLVEAEGTLWWRPKYKSVVIWWKKDTEV